MAETWIFTAGNCRLNLAPSTEYTSARVLFAMNYPLLPADAAENAWQITCCAVTLVMAMLSWIVCPR